MLVSVSYHRVLRLTNVDPSGGGCNVSNDQVGGGG